MTFGTCNIDLDAATFGNDKVNIERLSPQAPSNTDNLDDVKMMSGMKSHDVTDDVPDDKSHDKDDVASL